MYYNSFVTYLMTLIIAPYGIVNGYFDKFNFPSNYNKLHAPKKEAPTDIPVKVLLLISILDITQINEINNDITMEMIIQRSWQEPRVELTTEMAPTKWEAIEAPDAEKFWKPDFFVSGLRTFKFQRGVTDLKHFMISGDKTVSETMRIELEVRCKFDFSNYPLDVQQCKLDFMSPMDPENELYMEWDPQTEFPVSFENKHGDADLSLRHLDIALCKNNFHTEMRWGKISTLRFWLIMERDLKSFIMETYLPTAMFVFMSWGSFLVKAEIVPGRMVLLVTNLLSLVTLFESSRSSAPPANGVKCLDIWLLTCITFIFFALLEYAFVLYKMHGKSPEKQTKLRIITSVYPTVHTPQFYMRTANSMEKRGNSTCLRPLLRQTGISRCVQCPCIRHITRLLYCSSTHATWHIFDQISIILFPILFCFYNCVYWGFFLSQRRTAKVHECIKN